MSGEDFSAWLAKWTKPDGDGGEAADPPPDDAPDDGFQPTWSPRAVEVSLARALGRTPEPLPPKTPKTPEPEPAPAPAPEPAPEPSPPPKLEPDTPRSSRRPGGSTKKLTPRPKKKKLKKKKEPKEAKRRWSVRDRRESGYASEPGDAGAPARREALERPALKDDDDESLLSSEAASPPRELSLDEQFYAAFPDKSAKNDDAEPAEDFSRPRPKSSYHRARVALAAPWGARGPAALPAVLEELRHHFCPNWRLELLRTGLHEEMRRRDIGIGDMFALVDEDHSLSLDATELFAMAQRLGCDTRVSDTDKLIDDHGDSDEGEMTIEQFVYWFHEGSAQQGHGPGANPPPASPTRGSRRSTRKRARKSMTAKARRSDALDAYADSVISHVPFDDMSDGDMLAVEATLFDGAVRDVIATFWKLTDEDGSGALSNDEYTALSVQMQRAIHEAESPGEPFDAAAAAENAANDWNEDRHGKDIVDLRGFHLSMLQLADAWADEATVAAAAAKKARAPAEGGTPVAAAAPSPETPPRTATPEPSPEKPWTPDTTPPLSPPKVASHAKPPPPRAPDPHALEKLMMDALKPTRSQADDGEEDQRRYREAAEASPRERIPRLEPRRTPGEPAAEEAMLAYADAAKVAAPPKAVVAVTVARSPRPERAPQPRASEGMIFHRDVREVGLAVAYEHDGDFAALLEAAEARDREAPRRRLANSAIMAAAGLYADDDGAFEPSPRASRRRDPAENGTVSFAADVGDPAPRSELDRLLAEPAVSRGADAFGLGATSRRERRSQRPTHADARLAGLRGDDGSVSSLSTAATPPRPARWTQVAKAVDDDPSPLLSATTGAPARKPVPLSSRRHTTHDLAEPVLNITYTLPNRPSAKRRRGGPSVAAPTGRRAEAQARGARPLRQRGAHDRAELLAGGAREADGRRRREQLAEPVPAVLAAVLFETPFVNVGNTKL
ncbi:serine/threonine kinase [Aureococcus anophagefferens]|nr:serine/threonine kinase [Aureococcus anophagefferens]